MYNFKGIISGIAGGTALICGVGTAIGLALTGNWWGLLCIPAFPAIIVCLVKLWLGSDA